MLTLGMQVQFNITDIFPRLETNFPTKKRTNQDYFSFIEFRLLNTAKKI